ncbi:MAG: CpaF family protein [Candidatus Norongarragalinales archaeon]
MAKIRVGYPFPEYVVDEPVLGREAKRLLEKFVGLAQRRVSVKEFCEEFGLDEGEAEEFLKSLDVSSFGKPLPRQEMEEVVASARKVVAGLSEAETIARGVARSLYGFKVVQPLFEDDDLEEIMVNGFSSPVMVAHRKHGLCKTNLRFKNEREYGDFLVQVCGGSAGAACDVRLPDGSRANVVFPPAASEAAVTVRKFRRQRLSFVELVEEGVFSSHLAAFLWLCIEGMRVRPLNVLFAGGTASGKTSSLDAFSCFIPPHERIISIEDTRELSLPGKENWVALEKTEELDLNALLRNSLRMRPDRIIVGEVRGAEAETLFTAMNIGQNGVLGTLHANSDRDAIQRLEAAPMNVPRDLIPLLDVVVVQHRVYDGGELKRRVTQVSEVSRIEDKIALNEVFKWDAGKESVVRTQQTSELVEKIALLSGNPISAVNAELDRRREIVDFLVEKKVKSQEDVTEFMKKYYAESLP